MLERPGLREDTQAAGLMSLEELGSKLKDLDNSRRIAEQELAALKDHRRRVQDLEQDRDALLESMAEMLRPPPRGTISAALFVLL